ncbi:MAG: DUF1800 domain-containing protein [Pirellulales bacterium]|nr:DUF1800 domain-containing protein [Pirellulales bacterium]
MAVTLMSRIDPNWAWEPYRPKRESPWNLQRVAHLYRRAAFGGRWQEIETALKAGPEKTLARLLNREPDQAEATSAFYADSETQVTALLATGNVENLPAWWLNLMARTPHPLLERVALVWHGHFATSAAKVEDAELMLAQNALIRRQALAEFQPLVLGMARDPAMLLWLDSATNKKAHPNENFAREVMELFCLGLGNYTENDIKESARAFTGWEVRHREFQFNSYQHDEGSKTVLGQTGNWNGEDIIRILLEQPAAAQFLVGKFYRAFISETDDPSPELIEALAAGYRKHNYNTGWLVERILSSNLFFSEHALGQRVKSPVEMAIGVMRGLNFSVNAFALADDLRAQGQAVFYPPNVKGWDGGREWINSAALLSRMNLIWAMVSGVDNRFKSPPDLAEIAAENGFTTPAEQVIWLTNLLLGGPLPADVQLRLTALAAENDNGSQRLARVVQAIAARPEFHVA